MPAPPRTVSRPPAAAAVLAQRASRAPARTPTPAPAGGRGIPLPAATRAPIEKSFGVSLETVRVHPESPAADALFARAFTVGDQIFLRPGESTRDLGLIAHEAAHVVQQQRAAAIQRWTPDAGDSHEHEARQAAAAVVHGHQFTVQGRTAGPRIQRLGISDALDYIADKANMIPGFRMFTIVLGTNPVNMSSVDRSPANILRAVADIIVPGGFLTRVLDEYGVFEKVGTWIDQQLRTLGLAASAIKQALMNFLNGLSLRRMWDLGLSGIWEEGKRYLSAPIDQVKSFLAGLVTGILQFIRDAVLKPLAKLAEKTDAYPLLKAVLGQDPITGDPVPQTADALIGGFMKMIGQEEIYSNIQKANAGPRALAWFMGTLQGLIGFVKQIPTEFMNLLKSLKVADFLPPTGAFGKVARAFGSFAGKFLSWALEQVLGLLKLIFEVVAPGAMPYIQKAAGAFKTIIENPIGFIGNLVAAGKQGFLQFAGNFLTHLKASLIGWLTGSLGGTGVYIPQSFSLMEIVKFVLSVLGLTWQNIRAKLVTAIGDTAVKALEAGFDIVKTLVTQGPAAAWEKILESLTNLREMVMDGIMTFVRDRVVQAAVTKLVMMLNPAGAFIQAVIAIYNTIMFFVERLRQIAQVAASFIDAISAIAAGNIGPAASRVERTMAGLLTLVISFLARIAGLGKVSDAVKDIINKIRTPINTALDKVVAWIVAQARKLGRIVAQAGLPSDPVQRMRLGMQAAAGAVARFAGRPVGAQVLTPLLAAIKVRYGFTSLQVVAEGDRWAIDGQINPRSRNVTNALIERVRERTAAAGAEFDPNQLSNAAMRRLYDRSRRLGLPLSTIEDLLFVAGRREKPITEERLLTQMNNWVRVVNPRGFPYRFENLDSFRDFGQAVMGGLQAIGLQSIEVRVQGSSLRNPGARDIDLAVMLDNAAFNLLLITSFAETAKRRDGTNLLRPGMSGGELATLANDVQSQPREAYNAMARTFAFAMRERMIRRQDVRGLNALQGNLRSSFGAIDISLMTSGGSHELSPFLSIR